MAEQSHPAPPMIQAEAVQALLPGVHVIEDRGIPLVPNIGIVEGRDAVLVVDTGMGPENGETVLRVARAIAGERPLILTLTHFHPEHAFGSQVFRGVAQIICNLSQHDEMAARGTAYLEMFRSFGPGVAAALEGTKIVLPDTVYHGARHIIDLGERRVELRNWGLAHTAGDQVVWLPEERVLFTGDLAEQEIFPIFPWFPPSDAILDAACWRAALVEMMAMDPVIVVPGHGSIGGQEILRAVTDYMDEVSDKVAHALELGIPKADLADHLAPSIRAAHPGWGSPEWIDFAVRYYADQA